MHLLSKNRPYQPLECLQRRHQLRSHYTAHGGRLQLSLIVSLCLYGRPVNNNLQVKLIQLEGIVYAVATNTSFNEHELLVLYQTYCICFTNKNNQRVHIVNMYSL